MVDEKLSLKGFSKRLIFEAIIKAGIFGLSIGFTVSFIIIAATAPVFLNGGYWGFWLALGTLLPVSALAGFLLYRRYFKVPPKTVASRIDGMGLEERMITAMELADDDSFIAKKLKEDAASKLQKVTPQKMKLSFHKWPFIIMAAAGLLAVISMTGFMVAAAEVRNTLAAPDNFSYSQEERLVRWSEVPNAGFYNVTLNDEFGALKDETSVALPVYFVTGFEPGNYVITVRANAAARSKFDAGARTEFKFRILSDNEVLVAGLIEQLRADIADSGEDGLIKSGLNEVIDNLESSLGEKDPVEKTVALITAAARETHTVLGGGETTEILFDANNGRGGDNITVMRIPENTGLNKVMQDRINAVLETLGFPNSVKEITEEDIPDGETLNGARYTVFGGWAAKSDEGLTILDNGEILTAIHGGERAFIAVWLDEEGVLENLIIQLRKIINAATLNETMRGGLLQKVDDLAARLGIVVPVNNAAPLAFAPVVSFDIFPTPNAAEFTIAEKVDILKDAAKEIDDYLHSFITDFKFWANNGVPAEDVFITKSYPLFVEKDIPKAPATAPEGTVFWGWSTDGETLIEGEDAYKQIISLIANGVSEFTAIWGDSELPMPTMPTEPDDGDPIDSDIDGEIGKAIDALNDIEKDSEDENDDGNAPDPEPGEGGYNIIDGKTDYRDDWDEMYNIFLNDVANGKYTPEQAEFLQKYYLALRPLDE